MKPNIYAAIDRFVAAVQSHITEPTEIVGAPWPSLVPGAMRSNCKECGIYISLSPASGLKMHTQFPLIPVICWGCFVARVPGGHGMPGGRQPR